MEMDLTQGPVTGRLLRFSLPMIAGNLLQQLYNVVDTLIVGRVIGPAALAAVGSSYSLMVLLTSVVLGLCMGSGVTFAQLYGARRLVEMKTALANAFVFVLAVCLALMVVAFALLEHLLIWLNIPPEALAYTRDYLRIIFGGMVFVYLYNFLAAALRSVGNTLAPLCFLALAAVANILLDLWFILGLNLGVAGAAWATVISQALSALAMAGYAALRGRQLLPRRAHWRPHPALLRQIMSNSLMTALQQSIMNLGILMIQGLVNSFGFAVSAAYATAVKIDGFAYMPAQDFGNAFATFAAQNTGAGKTERVRRGLRSAAAVSAAFCLAAGALVFLLARELMLCFVQGEETQVIGLGVGYLRIVAPFYAGIGLLFLFYGFYRGLGRAGVSVVLTVISLGKPGGLGLRTGRCGRRERHLVGYSLGLGFSGRLRLAVWPASTAPACRHSENPWLSQGFSLCADCVLAPCCFSNSRVHRCLRSRRLLFLAEPLQRI